MRKGAKKLFQELSRRCEPEDVYSVRETATAMGVNYDYIDLCASESDELNEILQMCRNRCECHAVHAGLFGKLTIEKVNKYWCENDDGFARRWGYKQDFIVYKSHVWSC